ncbi:MAG: DUF389 domain-containing protein [Lachnospiraceae bacterium]|nr:DUF389 domain-containing protein [Lachnospiraceae bacterium]
MKEDKNSRSLKEIIISAFSVRADTAPNEEIQSRLYDAGNVTGTNLCMMTCANIIACVGLNAGSMTVVVGAMLIEPLMGSILMIAYSGVSADSKMFRDQGIGFFFQIMASIIASTIYFLLSPVKTPTKELLTMTQPTLFDVIVAFVGGIAGVIGQTRTEKVNTIIPGVAIATSLMPPLCACGYSIANGNLSMLYGSAYLFVINSYFIALGATLVLSLLEIPIVEDMSDEEWGKSRKKMFRNTVIILIPAVIAAVYRLLT